MHLVGPRGDRLEIREVGGHEVGLEPHPKHSGGSMEPTQESRVWDAALVRGGGRDFYVGPSVAPSSCWGVRVTAWTHIPPLPDYTCPPP